jgi:hypothetical protein
MLNLAGGCSRIWIDLSRAFGYTDALSSPLSIAACVTI